MTAVNKLGKKIVYCNLMLYNNKFNKNLYFDKIHIPCFAILLREITDLTFLSRNASLT